MLNFRLAPTAFVHFAADSAVLLDTRSNRYHGLEADQAAALQIALGGSAATHYPVVTEADVAMFAACLEARGILTTSAPSIGDRAGPPAIAPAHSLADAPAKTAVPVNARYALQILRLFLRSAFWLKRGRLDTALAHLRQLHSTYTPTRSPDESIDLVRSFNAIRPYIYSSKDQCLLDSLILTQFLLNQGVSATFFIGVRILPFAAHSWVQLSDCVLNCSLYCTQRSHAIVVI
ncbi:MAG: lasso peptide biosynthesis B2 protein [Proteobacteria bacterium]|nr:lasso peptide biosynthesis B2 protein [Pseudomonadota bacterium]